ncbi:uncharacterized protein LOC142226517 [Haematobia irritans]|uniref:uncharacterized protein LOC142226517 n=1 Tax=Haematobia irritans TaxID=7368 RepID=UPI003F5069B8
MDIRPFDHNHHCSYSSLGNKMFQMYTTNRRRSFKRRRLASLYGWLGVAVICVVLQNIDTIDAVPMSNAFMRIYNSDGGLHFLHHRVSRDVAMVTALQASSLQQKENTKEAMMQASSTEITMDQPQGQCLLDGEYVPETTVFCEKQVGCRAIQKTGHCCPDYKCDCQKDGKTYLNGDKLVDPETPCTVCYCQGGEILCSSVTCFHRDDCTPKYIPGVCCPEYDNCPVTTSLNKTLTTTSTTTPKPEIPVAVENAPKITIKEITKPTEIRITDDNKAIHQMLKPAITTTTTTTSTTTTTTSPSTTSSASTTTPAPSTQIISTTVMPIISQNTPILGGVDAIKETKKDVSMETLSVDTIPSAGNKTKLGINSGDTLKLAASVTYPPPSSSTTTVRSPTTHVMESGEVDDPVPALSIFSTQGLPEDPSKVNIKREYFVTTEGLASQNEDGSGEYGNSELIYGNTASAVGSASASSSTVGQHSTNGLDSQLSSVELDSDTAGSDNIYHIILTTEGPRSTSIESYLALKGVVSSTEGPFEDLSSPSLLEPKPSPIASIKVPSSTEGSEQMISSTEPGIAHQHLDEDEIPLEINPAYPSLPADDFSIRGDNNYQLTDIDDLGEEPRSISGAHDSTATGHEMVKNSKHLDDIGFGSGSGSGGGSGMGEILNEELAANPSSTTSPMEGSGNMELKDTQKYQKKLHKAPEIVQFMYSAEDSSEETTITNSSDFQMENMKKSEDSSLESTEILKPFDSLISMEDGSGSGSGAGELKQEKEREPTTPKPRRINSNLDIDELHDASGNGPQDDPKDDAESIKLDDSQTDATADNDKSPKGNILSVKNQKETV